MLFLLFCFYLADEGTTVRFDGTEIYEPIAASEAAVSADGHLYLMDFKGKRIRHYGADGGFIRDIGREGKGPGEFKFLSTIRFAEGRLYAVDMMLNNISEFQADGTFVRTLPLPERGVEVEKVQDGWVTVNLTSFRDPNKPIEVKRYDANMENPQTLASWRRPEKAGDLMIRRTGGSIPSIPFNPVRDNFYVDAGPEGRYLYISHPGSLKVTVLDTVSGKTARTIEREDQPIPFNEDYGNQQLDALKERNKERGMAVKFVADFPDSFPIVRNFFVTPDGHLAIEKWTAKPDEMKNVVMLDSQGNQRQPGYAAANGRRLLGIQEGHAYVACFDAEGEEAYVMKAPFSKIDNIVADHPAEGERQPRMMMITR